MCVDLIKPYATIDEDDYYIITLQLLLQNTINNNDCHNDFEILFDYYYYDCCTWSVVGCKNITKHVIMWISSFTRDAIGRRTKREKIKQVIEKKEELNGIFTVHERNCLKACKKLL